MTDLQLHGVGLGLAALGRPGYINLGHQEDLGSNYDVAAMEVQSHRVLDAAYDGGVRYFDVARSYGRSEAFVATWLAERELSPRDVIVGSKWGYRYTADWQVRATQHEVKEHTVEHLRTQLEETRSILGGHLSLYQIHSATLETGVLTNAAVLSRLAELKAAGVAIGFTTSGPQQHETILRGLAAEVDGQRVFDTVQCTYNLLERSAEPAMIAAKAAGLRVIVKEVVANGRLTARGDIAALVGVAERNGTTPDAIAMSFVRAQPFVDVVLSGAATVAHLRSNLRTVNVTALGDFANLVEDPDNYWSTRANLAWN